MIIWLASYPRSGNTYFRVLLKHFFDLSTYSAYKDQLLADQPEIRELVGHVSRPLSLPDMATVPELYIVKTHELPGDDIPAIYLVRDGRDALVSYARYILSFERESQDEATPEMFRDTLHDLIVLNASFGGWGPHVLAWTQRRAPTVVIRFEDLIHASDPQELVRNALARVGYDPDEQDRHRDHPPTFAALHEMMPDFFRKGKIGAWQAEMPPDLHMLFWGRHGAAMRKIGYARAPLAVDSIPKNEAYTAAEGKAWQKNRDEEHAMDAVTFSIDPNLIRFLTEQIAFDVFIETGTYLGETVERAKLYFPETISIECSEPYYQAAASRFRDDPSVTIYQGDSGEVLADLMPQLEGKATLFWLDAHCCAHENISGATSRCPLLQELAAIGRLNTKSVILIDDARFFLAPPGMPHDYAQWPGWKEVWQGLSDLSNSHEFIVINDVIVYYPRHLKETVRAFAHEQSIDWLSMMDKSRRYDTLLQEVKAKEQVIEEIHAAAEERLQRIRQFGEDLLKKEEIVQRKDRELATKDEVIEGQDAVIQTKDRALAARDEVMQRKDRELAAKDEVIQAKDRELAARDEVMQRKDRELATKDEVIARQKDMIQSKDRELETKNELIQATTSEVEAKFRKLVAKKDRELAARDEVIQRKDQELATKNEVIKGKEEALRAKHGELEAKNRELAAWDEVIQSKDRELAAKDEVIQAKDSALEARDRELAARDEVIQSKDQELETKNEVIKGKEEALRAKHGELEAKNRELAANEEIIEYKEQELAAKEDVLQTQHQELLAKEEIIQQLDLFRRTSWRYWLSYRLWPFLQRVGRVPLRLLQRPIQALRAAFRPRLGDLNQHPPIPLRLPKRYHTIRCTVTPPPTVSVVTPSYNHASFLERTIQSVLEQPYPELEYILQDGGSTDGTDRILERYRAQCRHVESRKDRGQAHAINLGFAHATGEIMAWLNSDDLLLPGALPYVANYLGRNPEVDVVYGHRILIDEQDREIGRWILPPHDDDILNWADYVPQETLFWRRCIWEKAGGNVDESFQFALDWDLLLRFQEAGARIVRLPRFLGAFRIYAEQKTSDWMDDVGQTEMTRLRERANGREVTWSEINENIRSYIRRSTYAHLLYKARLLRL